MCENEIRRYQSLNKLAEINGVVILGGSADCEIPLCELKQAFALDMKLYNRSAADLSVKDAAAYYDACIHELHPDRVLLHIGEADLACFAENPSGFDRSCRELIGHIRSLDPNCDIAVISLKNPDENEDITEMNRHLKYIADSEQCEYGDISARKVWNPKASMDAASFVYSIGFVRSLKNKRPLYDLVKILFCYGA